MTEHSGPGEYSLKKERTFVQVFLLFACLSLAHSVHNAWFIFSGETTLHPPVKGTFVYHLFEPSPDGIYAPDAYRIAIPTIGRTLVLALHADRFWVAAGLDFLFSIVALSLLYRLAVDGLPVEGGTGKRLLIVALFLAWIQFPLAWIVPWQRPETTPNAMYVAIALFCLVKGRESNAWNLLLIAATVFQGFVRADIAFILGAALFLTALTGKMDTMAPRSSLLLKGAAIAGIAGVIQLYLQIVRFPHLHYWPYAPMIQLPTNLKPRNAVSFVIDLLPFLALALYCVVRRVSLKPLEGVIVVASVLYFCLWAVVGVLGEVRIFVPFLLALSVVAARVTADALYGLRIPASEL